MLHATIIFWYLLTYYSGETRGHMSPIAIYP